MKALIQKLIITAFIIGFSELGSYCQNTKYVITKLLPDQKIKIGDKWCGLDDTFNSNETIYWDETLEVQAFRAENLTTYSVSEFSKRQFKNKQQKNMSLNEYVACISKSEKEEFYLLWKDESIMIPCSLDTSKYKYKISVVKTNTRFDARIVEDGIRLSYSDLIEFDGAIRIEILAINKKNHFDIQAIVDANIELID